MIRNLILCATAATALIACGSSEDTPAAEAVTAAVQANWPAEVKVWTDAAASIAAKPVVTAEDQTLITQNQYLAQSSIKAIDGINCQPSQKGGHNCSFKITLRGPDGAEQVQDGNYRFDAVDGALKVVSLPE